MKEERTKILKMLEEGKITVDEATKLIEAVDDIGSSNHGISGDKARFVRVRIWDDGGEKVKVNVPLALARTVFRAIPPSARQQIDLHGVDLEQLLNGVMDNLKPGKLVEIQDGGKGVEVVIE